MNRALLIIALLCGVCLTASAQGYSYYENSQFDFFQRQMYRPGIKSLHSSLRSYSLDELRQVFDTDSALYDGISVPDKKMNIFRRFLHGNLLEWSDDDKAVAINPFCDFQMGKDGNLNTYTNSRGFMVDGHLGKNFWFYMDFSEVQARYPYYYKEYIKDRQTVPGLANTKWTDSGDSDYEVANGYVAFRAFRWLDFCIGKGKTFIGDGYRSMMLSDVAPAYPMLRMNATFWNVKYMFMISQLRTHENQHVSNNAYHVKYAVTHYLDWNLCGRLSLGLFENVTMAKRNAAGEYRAFDWEYLNPFIILQPGEYNAGSPDKLLVGLNTKLILSKGLTLYGQFVLNEFRVKELFSNSGWWANKYAYQIGMRTTNLFRIRNLDVLAEYNHARPFIYTQYTALCPYTHHDQPLAHPLGANFKEGVGIANYRHKRLMLRGQINIAKYGADTDSTFYGHDIRRPSDDRTTDYGHTTGQGVRTDLLYADGSVSFLINPRCMMNIAIGGRYRRLKDDAHTEESKHFYVALRWSLKNLYYDF